MKTINTIESPRARARLFTRLLLWVVGIFASLALVLWAVTIYVGWSSFRSDLTTYHGGTIGMTKRDAQYVLGAPQTVQGPWTEAEGGWKISSPLRVNSRDENEAIPLGYGSIPAGKSPMDYSSWHFWNERGSYNVDFDPKSNRLESVSCYSEKPAGCDALFGVRVGSSEDEVLKRLGPPDKQQTSGGEALMGMPVQVTKTMDYTRLGLHLVLAKKAVTRISKHAPQDISFWWWLTHGRI